MAAIIGSDRGWVLEADSNNGLLGVIRPQPLRRAKRSTHRSIPIVIKVSQSPAGDPATRRNALAPVSIG